MGHYNELSAQLAREIEAIVDEGRFYIRESMKPDFSHDEKAMYGTAAPEAAVEVASAEEIAAIMRLCNDAGVPITVRGAGTGLCGGSVAMSGGLVLSMAKMNKIIALDEDNLTITVEPGVTLQEVMDAAAEKGLCYPPDPGEKTASIGGNLNTNAGGPRAMRFGATRDYVLAATAVLPTGEIIKLGAPVVKSSNGLNLLQLVIGSEGTLAVVTELTLKLIPAKKYDISFLMPYESVAEAMSAAIVLKKASLDPVGLELVAREFIEFSASFTGEHTLPEDGEATLIVTFEANTEDALDMLMEQFAELAEETGPLDILVVDTPTLKRSIWAAHAALNTSIESGVKRFDESDVVLPMTKVAEYIEAVSELASAMGLTMQVYGHAGDGSLHIFVYNDELEAESFASKSAAFMTDSYAKCTELGGVVSGEHGIGHGKKAYLEAALGEDVMGLMRRVKAAFDPKEILNPGKVV